MWSVAVIEREQVDIVNIVGVWSKCLNKLLLTITEIHAASLTSTRQNVEYKRPAGAYPLCDFHKICRICSPFQDALAIKFR